MSNDQLIAIITHSFQVAFLICSILSFLWTYLYRSIGWLLWSHNCTSDKCKAEMNNKEEMFYLFQYCVMFRTFILVLALRYAIVVDKWQYVALFLVACIIVRVIFEIFMRSKFGNVKDKYHKLSECVLDDFFTGYLLSCCRYLLVSNLAYGVVFLWWAWILW